MVESVEKTLRMVEKASICELGEGREGVGGLDGLEGDRCEDPEEFVLPEVLS